MVSTDVIIVGLILFYHDLTLGYIIHIIMYLLNVSDHSFKVVISLISMAEVERASMVKRYAWSIDFSKLIAIQCV